MSGSFNMRTLIFLSCLLLLLSASCRRESFSPSDSDSFIKFFGNLGINEGIDVKSLGGGGYVIAGTTSSGSSGTNIVLLITDKFGNESLRKEFGGPYNDSASSLAVLSDGGFAILGSTTVDDQSLITDMYLIRTDSRGNEKWSRTYGGNSFETGHSLAETSDGGLILLGSTKSRQTGISKIYMIKTDENGEVLRTETHGGFINDDVGLNVVETTDGGFIVAGYTMTWSVFGQVPPNIFVLKTRSDLRLTHASTFGNTGQDYGKSILLHPEGGYMLMGTTTNSSSNTKSVYLGRLDEDIKSVWYGSYGGTVNHVAACMKVTPEGDYIITGTLELSAENHVIFLLKTDSLGNQLFFETYGGTGLQRAHSVDLTRDGGYIITGLNETGGASLITLIKTNPEGQL
jgi:hypothetical protein